MLKPHRYAHFRLRKPRHTDRYRYVRRRWHWLFGLVDRVCQPLWTGLRRLVGRQPREQLAPRSILLVQLDHLGDAIITAAVLPAIRARYPAARIEVLAAPWNCEVFEACREVEVVHVSRINRFARGWRPHWLLAQAWWGLRLRRRRFDLAIDIRGEMPLALILWLAGAKRRVGWNCGGGGFLLTDSAAYLPGRPEMESRLALLRLIDIAPTADVVHGRPWFIPPAPARASIANWLEDSNEGGPRIVIHIGAGTAAKRWPDTHWRELIGQLILEFGPQIVLVGSRNERALAADVLDGKSWPGVSDCTGQFTVCETAALIERADVFIGADSGPAHLAAAVGTPAVVLFSGTNRVRQWRPWGRASVVKHPVSCSPCHLLRCPMASHPCMAGISPEAVARRVSVILEGSGKRKGLRVQGSGFRDAQAEVTSV